LRSQKFALFTKVLRLCLVLDLGTKLAAWLLLSHAPMVIIPREFMLRLVWNETFIGAPQQEAMGEVGYSLVALMGALIGLFGLVAAAFVDAWHPLWRRVALVGGAFFAGAIAAEALGTGWMPDLSPRASMLVRGVGVQTWLAVVIYTTRGRYLTFSCCVLWAGNAGNLVNALFADGVIDFLSIPAIGDFIFNFADVFVTGGVALVALFLPLRVLEMVVPLGSWAPSRTFEYTPRPCEAGSRAS